jgi:hypothetical protein
VVRLKRDPSHPDKRDPIKDERDASYQDKRDSLKDERDPCNKRDPLQDKRDPLHQNSPADDAVSHAAREREREREREAASTGSTALPTAAIEMEGGREGGRGGGERERFDSCSPSPLAADGQDRRDPLRDKRDPLQDKRDLSPLPVDGQYASPAVASVGAFLRGTSFRSLWDTGIPIHSSLVIVN